MTLWRDAAFGWASDRVVFLNERERGMVRDKGECVVVVVVVVVVVSGVTLKSASPLLLLLVDWRRVAVVVADVVFEWLSR